MQACMVGSDAQTVAAPADGIPANKRKTLKIAFMVFLSVW
jgi:hypothetical protein